MTAQHPMRGDVAVLVPAAGLGTRLGAGVPKALRELGGRTLLAHAVDRLTGAGSVGHIVVAAPVGMVDTISLTASSLTASAGLTVVEGGATRQQSVAAALAAVPAAYQIILVHDAARAFAPVDLIERVAAAVRDGHAAVIPVLPVVDTIKTVDDSGHVVDTLDRSALRAVQTPQGFRRDVLEAAHRAAVDALTVQSSRFATAGLTDDPSQFATAGLASSLLALTDDASRFATAGFASSLLALTDDSGLVEKLGVRVYCVPGSEAALKITRPADLAVAEAFL